MSKTTQIPRIIKLNTIQGWKVYVTFSNGEYRVIDFEQFFDILQKIVEIGLGKQLEVQVR